MTNELPFNLLDGAVYLCLAVAVIAGLRSGLMRGLATIVGYLIAASGPILFGSLHAASGGWALPFALLVAVMVGQGVVGAYAGRDRFVLDRRS